MMRDLRTSYVLTQATRDGRSRCEPSASSSSVAIVSAVSELLFEFSLLVESMGNENFVRASVLRVTPEGDENPGI